MRYASERLSLFRTVFVQVAALLLFAAGGVLFAAAEKELDVRSAPHAEMAPSAGLQDIRLPAVLKTRRASSPRLPRNRSIKRLAVHSRPLP